MKLPRILTGLAAALATAMFIGLAAPAAVAQDNPATAPAAAAAPAAPAAAPAATAPAAAAAPAAPAAPPSCSATVTEKCTVNSGDTAWVLTSVALVLMMTIPGLGLFYGGMVSKKNVGDTVMTSFAITALVTVIYFVLTYSLAFTGGSSFIGGFSRVFLQGIHYDLASGMNTPNPLAPTIPETVYMMFQMTFAIITPALIAGSFAERMKFSAMLWFIGLWAIFVYAPVAHWVWGPDGFMSAVNVDSKGVFQGWFQVLDFAGGTVVHINAGVAGLVSCILLGKRKEPGPGHNMVLTFIGTGLLWVGWFGFNAGSAVTAGLQAGMAMTVTQIATAVAALTWMFVEWAPPRQANRHRHLLGRRRRPRRHHAGFGLCRSGRSAGDRHRLRNWLLLGATALKHAFGYDDALDAFGVHAVGGIIGALLTGVFAVNEFSGHSGLLEGDVGQFINQIKGVVTVIVYDAIVTFIILKIVDVAIGLRVTEEVERDGLDLALHGEVVH